MVVLQGGFYMDKFVRIKPSLEYLKVIMRTFDGYTVDDLMAIDSDKSQYKKRGIAFEKMCIALLESMGCRCESTPVSDDDGIDIICYAQNRVINIQCKNYSGSVGKEAVQEVISGSFAHPCHAAAVFTNSDFTASAQEFARKINATPGDARVFLVDGYDLQHFSMKMLGLEDTVEQLTVSAGNIKDYVSLQTSVKMLSGYETEKGTICFAMMPDVVSRLIQEKKLQKSNNILEPYISKRSIELYNKHIAKLMNKKAHQIFDGSIYRKVNTNSSWIDRNRWAGFNVKEYDFAKDERYSNLRCRKVNIQDVCFLLDGYISLFGVQYKCVTSENVLDLLSRGYLESACEDGSKIYYASVYRYNVLLKNGSLQPVRFDEGFYQADKIVYDLIAQRQFDMEMWLGLHYGLRTTFTKIVPYVNENVTFRKLIDDGILEYSSSLGYEGVSRKSVEEYIRKNSVIN